MKYSLKLLHFLTRIEHFFQIDAESLSPSHGPNLSEVETSNSSPSEMVAESSPADAELAEKKRLAAERRKKLLDQVKCFYFY